MQKFDPVLENWNFSTKCTVGYRRLSRDADMIRMLRSGRRAPLSLRFRLAVASRRERMIDVGFLSIRPCRARFCKAAKR